MQSTIIITPNQAFYGTFYLTSEETEGRYVRSEGDHGGAFLHFILWKNNLFFDKKMLDK